MEEVPSAHEAACAPPPSPIISLQKFQKYQKIKIYLKNVKMKFYEHFAGVTCRYLLLTVLINLLLALSTYGGAWHLLYFHQYDDFNLQIQNTLSEK